MTTFLLVRHGAHLLGGETLAGRLAGVRLSPLGHEQAARAADRLARLPIRAIYSSPIERVRETAQYLAGKTGLPVEISDGLAEIDFGSWTGRRLDELRPLARFRQWNEFRSGVRPPEGELMLEVQGRIMSELLRLRERHPDQVVACFSHGDVIKSAVAYCLGVHLDLMKRIEISLASISTVAIGDYGPWVLGVNNTPEIELP